MLMLLFVMVCFVAIVCYILGKGAVNEIKTETVREVKSYKPLSDESRQRLRERLSK